MKYLVKFQVGSNETFSFWRKMDYVPKESTAEFYNLCEKEFPAYCFKGENYMEIAEVVELDKVSEIIQ